MLQPKKCGCKTIVGMWERQWVSESNGRENILITEKIEDGREASRGFTRQPHSLASLWLPWRWCRRFKPRVTLGKDWLESHLMQNSATTWFSQRFTSDENLALYKKKLFPLAFSFWFIRFHINLSDDYLLFSNSAATQYDSLGKIPFLQSSFIISHQPRAWKISPQKR